MLYVSFTHSYSVLFASTDGQRYVVAYLQTVHSSPVKKKEIFQRWHLHVAMSRANEELADPERVEGDGLLLTITLLMNIAVGRLIFMALLLPSLLADFH